MALATQRENVLLLADTNTFTGPRRFSLLLVAGVDAASLTLSIGGNELIVVKAAAGLSQEVTGCVSVGNETVTVATTGTAPKAYAILEVD